MLFGLFERGPRNPDDLRRKRDRMALNLTNNHLNQLDRDIKRSFRQQFQSHNDQLPGLGQQTLYLRPDGDNIVACDAAGNIYGIVERPLATEQPGSNHHDRSFEASTTLGNTPFPGQDIDGHRPEATTRSTGLSRNGSFRPTGQVPCSTSGLQISAPTLPPFFPPEGGSPSTVRQPAPSSHLILPSPPPSGEPSLLRESRPASRNNDAETLSDINQVPANDTTPQLVPAQISTIPLQYGWDNSAPPDVLTSAELSPLNELRPNLQAQESNEARALPTIFSPLPYSRHEEDATRVPQASNYTRDTLPSTHLSLDRTPRNPWPEVIAADTFDEATKALHDKLDSMGPTQNQPQQTARPVEDSNNSTLEALRTWSATMCEILKEHITRYNRETESSPSISTGGPTFIGHSLLEICFKLLEVLNRLSCALSVAYHVPSRVLLDTKEGLQRYCFEMHRPRTQQDQLIFLTDLSQGVEALTVELRTHINSPTTPSDLQRLSLPRSMRNNGTEHQGVSGGHVLTQLATHRGGIRYPVDDRSTPTVTSHRLSYADFPQVRGNATANEGAVMNDHITPIMEGSMQRAVPYTDGMLSNSTEDGTPLSQMRMLQRPRGSFTWPWSPHNPAARNPPVTHGPPIGSTNASPDRVEAAQAPVPALVIADVPLQHPCPERHYQQAEFMASPGTSWLRRLRLAKLLNIPPFWK